MISNIKKDRMGTVSFDGKFSGQRKTQDFIVYPMTEESPSCRIQSDKRAGFINLQNGAVSLSNNQYIFVTNSIIDTLSGEDLMMLKAAIFATASGKAGTNGIVYCDNSGAINVFAA